MPTRTSPSHSTGASNGCLQRVPPTGASNWLTVWVPPTGASNGCQKFQEHSFYMFMGFLCQRVPPTGVKNFTSILSRVPWGFLANGCLPTGAKKLTSVHSTCLGFFCQRVLVQRMPNKIQWGNVDQKARKKNAGHSFYMFMVFCQRVLVQRMPDQRGSVGSLGFPIRHACYNLSPSLPVKTFWRAKFTIGTCKIPGTFQMKKISLITSRVSGG